MSHPSSARPAHPPWSAGRPPSWRSSLRRRRCGRRRGRRRRRGPRPSCRSGRPRSWSGWRGRCRRGGPAGAASTPAATRTPCKGRRSKMSLGLHNAYLLNAVRTIHFFCILWYRFHPMVCSSGNGSSMKHTNYVLYHVVCIETDSFARFPWVRSYLCTLVSFSCVSSSLMISKSSLRQTMMLWTMKDSIRGNRKNALINQSASWTLLVKWSTTKSQQRSCVSVPARRPGRRCRRGSCGGTFWARRRWCSRRTSGCWRGGPEISQVYWNQPI